MNSPLKFDYYTDILCIWAWVSELRVAALQKEFGESLHINMKYMDVFGDVNQKMNTTWKDRGGFTGFSEHIQKTAKSFPELEVHPLLWTDTQPLSSSMPHLYIKAVQLNESNACSQQFALAIRKAFFIDARNISNQNILQSIAKEQGVNLSSLLGSLDNGSAMASLMQDYQSAKAKSLQGSPTYILDNGRQTLFGNVNYRVLKANVESLLQPSQTNSPSWY